MMKTLLHALHAAGASRRHDRLALKPPARALERSGAPEQPFCCWPPQLLDRQTARAIFLQALWLAWTPAFGWMHIHQQDDKDPTGNRAEERTGAGVMERNASSNAHLSIAGAGRS